MKAASAATLPGCVPLLNEMVAKLFLLQFYLFGCVIVRLRKMLFAVAGLRPQNILLVFLASLENLKFRYEIVLQPSLCVGGSLAQILDCHPRVSGSDSPYLQYNESYPHK
ncbi:MAG: hypothetical protein AUJ36_00730 [Parcubacteria group bacterium CG1_02_41_26]|nr:MAG: hypothetical protein AUJ36_00730 [Parcubacteria group bacterium CG1_02_41_26]